MPYLIRLYPNDSQGPDAPAPYIIQDYQLTGSPAVRLRGLPWRALQSTHFCLSEPGQNATSAQWILNVCQQLRDAGMESFDSSSPNAAPFGDANSAHMDCADWLWSAERGLWLGEVRSSQGPQRAPLFAFWLEQALRSTSVLYDLRLLLAADPARAALPKKIASLGASLPDPLLAPFQIERLGQIERDILVFALNANSESPTPAPNSLPSIVADKIIQASSKSSLDALSGFDPAGIAAMERLLIEDSARPGYLKKTARL